MAVVYPRMVFSPALPDSPTLPDFNNHSVRVHNVKYAAAFETEHSRDLYLQGAMAVGQIARLLEELCAGQYDSDDNAEDEDVVELTTRPSDNDDVHQFLSHEKQGQINAWAHGVLPAEDIIKLDWTQPCDVDVIEMEDADTTYLRGACVVGDIAELLKDLIIDLSDDDQEEYKTSSHWSSEQVAPAQLGDTLNKHPDADFEARMKRLSARLAQLEMDIKEFSQERNHALKQMEIDDAVQDKEQSDCSQGSISRVELSESLTIDDALDVHHVLESEESAPITRVWTTTDTTTSGFSLVTPVESEAEALHFASVKNYFWSEDS